MDKKEKILESWMILPFIIMAGYIYSFITKIKIVAENILGIVILYWLLSWIPLILLKSKNLSNEI